MAYQDIKGGFTQQIPVFSMNAVDADGTSFGGQYNDNRRQLTEARFLIANQGDESGICKTIP
jgi:hypothetical protein